MTEDTKASYLFLANHLRDIHFQLQEPMRTKRHKWEFVETQQGSMAADLMPLYSIILLLEKLASPDAPPVFPDLGAGLPEN